MQWQEIVLAEAITDTHNAHEGQSVSAFNLWKVLILFQIVYSTLQPTFVVLHLLSLTSRMHVVQSRWFMLTHSSNRHAHRKDLLIHLSHILRSASMHTCLLNKIKTKYKGLKRWICKNKQEHFGRRQDWMRSHRALSNAESEQVFPGAKKPSVAVPALKTYKSEVLNLIAILANH